MLRAQRCRRYRAAQGRVAAQRHAHGAHRRGSSRLRSLAARFVGVALEGSSLPEEQGAAASDDATARRSGPPGPRPLSVTLRFKGSGEARRLLRASVEPVVRRANAAAAAAGWRYGKRSAVSITLV